MANIREDLIQMELFNDSYIGRIEKDGKFYNGNGSYIGRIDLNGMTYDGNGAYRGRIDSNGMIYDKDSSYLGKLSGMKKDQIAYLFFFK